MSTADAALVIFEHTGSMGCECLKGNVREKRNAIACDQWQVSTCAGIEASP